MKSVLASRLEQTDIKQLRRMAGSLGLTVPEFLTEIARRGQNLEAYHEALEKTKAEILAEVRAYVDELKKAVRE